MLSELELSLSESNKWVASGRDTVSDDLADLRCYPELFSKGTEVMQQLHHLLVLSDDLRKQQMLLKFFLQLKTFSCDNVAKIDKPYNAENAAIHRKVLEDSNAAFIIVKKGFFETD